ncbi:putative xyloglucan endotransglucosylase/hydrolase protein 1 [Nicotiana tabacum]|uniref:Xyloglucan endotransglucosylase/hydrolase n=2 Tax=Nicotiana TaxID=4085 RepID=A0A1S3Z1V8_TOBAC|nr:PREDICTED: putative xyloglucan endotransglucosylase/hydrolase protein 1 [Nicotiana sylvestris]XP_016458343.1 PREDICTED: putative xyloglucan endotransglucosylase/hydrolase protein 1 [Nicotiana tabacum]
MAYFLMNIVTSLILLFIVGLSNADISFNNSYEPTWGENHLSIINQGTEVTLLLDNSSGAGFKSKFLYESGLFVIRMKLPDKKTGGVITSLYLTSQVDGSPPGTHDEIDFEFLGTQGKLQTNVFANDWGFREQIFQLPFDPSQDFHTYQILYNPFQIVFFIDDIPVREFMNLKVKANVNYPTSPMQIEASVWYSNSSGWAGDIDWSLAPFIAHYQHFKISGCFPQPGNDCSSPVNQPWNRFKVLSPLQRQKMANFRKQYMTYDYCVPGFVQFPECSYNNS